MNHQARQSMLSQLSKAGAIISPMHLRPWEVLADRYALENVITTVTALKAKHGKPVTAGDAKSHLAAVYPDVQEPEAPQAEEKDKDEAPAKEESQPAVAKAKPTDDQLISAIQVRGMPQRIAGILGCHQTVIYRWRNDGIPDAWRDRLVAALDQVGDVGQPAPKATQTSKAPRAARPHHAEAAAVGDPVADRLTEARDLLDAALGLRQVKNPMWRTVAKIGHELAGKIVGAA